MKQSFPHQFVEFVPKILEASTLYVSVQHAVAVHLCACGCGEKVVTPLAPIHWKMTFDGRSISLYPSIGNHAFACKSHYWLEDGNVRWSYAMSDELIAKARLDASEVQRNFYSDKKDQDEFHAERNAYAEIPPAKASTTIPWWRRLLG